MGSTAGGGEGSERGKGLACEGDGIGLGTKRSRHGRHRSEYPTKKGDEKGSGEKGRSRIKSGAPGAYGGSVGGMLVGGLGPGGNRLSGSARPQGFGGFHLNST